MDIRANFLVDRVALVIAPLSPEQLRTAFDIKATLFSLPTLQPIVENAVRYGVGFDPTLPKEDGRTHIGIANVRDRLRRMVNGTLEIASIPGRGTEAVLTIPKGALSC